jgi:hypothetical protein
MFFNPSVTGAADWHPSRFVYHVLSALGGVVNFGSPLLATTFNPGCAKDKTGFANTVKG